MKWIDYKEQKPPYGVEVLAYHHDWVNEDFNPKGIRVGFLQDNLAADGEQELKSGMLTYEDAEPIQIHAPRVEMMPSPRKGFFGRIKDRILGPVMKPQAVMVLDKEAQERLRKQLEDLRRDDLAACDLTEEDVIEHFTRPIVLARGHHVRNADGTVTDVSNDPNYECKQ